MKLYIEPVSLFLFTAFWTYIVWNWVRWLRSARGDAPRWRLALTFLGLCFATASSFLSAFLFIHAILTGGYPFYHPVELFCIRVGALTALLGLIGALLGKGKLRIPVAVMSTLNLLLWFMDAMWQ